MNRALLIRSALVAAMVWQGMAVSVADAPVAARKPPAADQGNEASRLAPPASQHELWQRLLKLLAEDGGFTPKDRVEAVLGIRFVETRQETDPPTIGAAYWHFLEIESEGLGKFRIVLFDDPKKTGLGISWGRNHCLNIPSATQDLLRLGWSGGERDVRQPWKVAQVDFHLQEEVAYVATHGLHPGTRDLQQRLTKLYLTSSHGHQSDCLNGFGSDVWRTPLHKQPTHTNPGE